MKDRYERDRMDMVEQQVRARGVLHEGVLSAMRKVPRHLFVPKGSEILAYGDHPLPIGHGQTISQPYIVGLMTELLEPDRNSRILEIGTGSGYQTAVLAELVNEVYTVERNMELSKTAGKLLAKLGYNNIRLLHGNGYDGWKEFAPYDGIIVTAAPVSVPEHLTEQLEDGANLVIPVGGPFEQFLKKITKDGDHLKEEIVTGVRFVKLVDG